MRIALTEEQERLRRELREYFGALVTPERREALATASADFGHPGERGEGSVYREVIRRLGADGWLGIGWPEEYGGLGRTAVEQLILSDEAAIAGVPLPTLTLNTVAPTIMRFGSEQQKRDLLPAILRGELLFSIGYSEPGAGTDLASLTTRATLDGDAWVVNGQKMWTSLVQYADYVWLACRTDPDRSGPEGLSVLLVPTDSEGFSFTPVQTVAGVGTSATYFNDVRVPQANVVGEVDGGWGPITSQLNLERVALTSAAPLVHSIDLVTEWARETGRIQHEWVRIALGRAYARTDMLTLMNHKLASSATEPAPADASATKVFGSELATEVYRALLEIVGPVGLVRSGSPGAVLHGLLERRHREALLMTFGGGTNEIQRDLIAHAGLGLPAAERRA